MRAGDLFINIYYKVITSSPIMRIRYGYWYATHETVSVTQVPYNCYQNRQEHGESERKSHSMLEEKLCD